jgi:hypothetical protein
MKTGLEKHEMREHDRQISFQLMPMDDWQMRIKIVASVDGIQKSIVCMNNESEIRRMRRHLVRELGEQRRASAARVHH